MSPPTWLDSSGRPCPTTPCQRCGRAAPLWPIRLEHLRLIGWQLFRAAEYVNWCGHGQEVIPWPAAGGWARLVPLVGEAGPQGAGVALADGDG